MWGAYNKESCPQWGVAIKAKRNDADNISSSPSNTYHKSILDSKIAHCMILKAKEVVYDAPLCMIFFVHSESWN